MINKKNIFKEVKGLLGKGRVSYDKKLTDPKRDWFIGLVLFMVIVVLGAVFSAQKFVIYRSIHTDGGDDDQSLVRYKESLIKEVLSVYQARKESFDQKRNASAPAVAVPPEVPLPTATTTNENGSSPETSAEPVSPDEVQMAI